MLSKNVWQMAMLYEIFDVNNPNCTKRQKKRKSIYSRLLLLL